MNHGKIVAVMDKVRLVKGAKLAIATKKIIESIVLLSVLCRFTTECPRSRNAASPYNYTSL